MGMRHLKNILTHGKEWGVDVVHGYDSSSLALQTASRLVTELVQAGQHSTRCSLASGSVWKLDHKPLDAAIISTPPEHHFSYAARLPNTHLLVEKPVAEADWDSLPDNGRLVLAAMNYRFHPAAAILHEAGAEWYENYFISYTSAQDRSSPERGIGPILSNLHCLDLIEHAVGEVDSIYIENGGSYGHGLVRLKGRGRDDSLYRFNASILTRLFDDGPRSLNVLVGHISYLGLGRGIEYQTIRKASGEVLQGQYDLEQMYIDELAEFFARCQEKQVGGRLPAVKEVYRLVKMVGPYKP